MPSELRYDRGCKIVPYTVMEIMVCVVGACVTFEVTEVCTKSLRVD
jgi:hypothetical protein